MRKTTELRITAMEQAIRANSLHGTSNVSALVKDAEAIHTFLNKGNEVTGPGQTSLEAEDVAG